jgi:hypothetical protein
MQHNEKKNIIISQMKPQLLGKAAIIWAEGKLTPGADEEWGKMSSSC